MPTRVGFGRRLGALVLDAIAVMVLSMIIGPLIGGLVGGLGGGAVGAVAGATGDATAPAAALGGLFGAIMGAAIGSLIVMVAYWVVEIFTAASPGKMLLGIKIRNTDSSAANTATLATRYAVKNIVSIFGLLAAITGITALSSVGGLLGLVVFIGCFFTLGASRQAIHDMIAKTAVYKTAEVRG